MTPELRGPKDFPVHIKENPKTKDQSAKAGSKNRYPRENAINCRLSEFQRTYKIVKRAPWL